MQKNPDLLQEMKIKLGAWLPELRKKEGSAVWKIEMVYRTGSLCTSHFMDWLFPSSSFCQLIHK
jgi:hypothetical protein